MIIDIYYMRTRPDKRHENALNAFGEGVRNNGLTSRFLAFEDGPPEYKGEYAAIFGTYKRAIDWTRYRKGVMDAYTKAGRRTIVIDSGYVKRDDYYMVGLDGLNGRADFRLARLGGQDVTMPPDGPACPACLPADRADRWEKLGVELKPMREDKGSNHILLCGQVPWDASVQGTNHIEWLQETANKLEKMTSRTVIFSRHPLSPSSIFINGVQNANASHLPTWLEDCHLHIAYNSNSGVDAMIAGVPTVAFDEGSMVWDVAERGLGNIEDPYFPVSSRRQNWANLLAYCQWSLDEMRSGEAATHILGD